MDIIFYWMFLCVDVIDWNNFEEIFWVMLDNVYVKDKYIMVFKNGMNVINY